MPCKLSYYVSLIFGVLALASLIANIGLVNENRTAQDTIAKNQASINKGLSLSQLNQNLVQALAEASTKEDGAPIKELLAAQGITLKTPPAAAPEVLETAKKPKK